MTSLLPSQICVSMSSSWIISFTALFSIALMAYHKTCNCRDHTYGWVALVCSEDNIVTQMETLLILFCRNFHGCIIRSRLSYICNDLHWNFEIGPQLVGWISELHGWYVIFKVSLFDLHADSEQEQVRLQVSEASRLERPTSVLSVEWKSQQFSKTSGLL